jgi:hypothetical protein
MALGKVIVLACAGTAAAFAPGAPALGLRSTAQVSRRATASVGPKMMADPSVISDAIQHLSTMETIPFIDEVTGDPVGFTAPVNHFGSVIGLWVLFSLPVWAGAYKQAGGQNPEWFGISHVAEDAPGLGLISRAAPDYNGPNFREGLEYVLSFAWKPPILIAWKPRADLDSEFMDPARDTVVSSLYKTFGGSSDKGAYYDEEDQLFIRSDIELFPETPLGKRREALGQAAGWYDGNPAFGKSLLEFAEETRKGKGKQFGTVTISAEELKKLRAEAAKK